MNNNKLALLGVIAVIAAGWAVLQSRIGQPASATSFASAPLIEGLPLESISSITVSSENGAKSVTLDRVEGVFVLKEKSNYPADVSKINDLISKCLDIRTRERITSDAANHADLKVTPETARYVFSFMDKEGKLLTGAAISPSEADSGRAFVRLLSGNDVYAVDNDPWLNTGALEYINTKLLEVAREKIRRVEVQAPPDTYKLVAGENADAVKLEAVPEGQKQKDTECRSVFGALSYLTFEDVMKESPEGAAFDHTYSCELSDTTLYTLSIAKQQDKYYARIAADFLDKTPVEKERRVESEEELKAKEAKLLAIDAVNTFNQRHKDWVYQIPSYKATELTTAFSALTESAAPPAPAESPAATPAAAAPEQGPASAQPAAAQASDAVEAEAVSDESPEEAGSEAQETAPVTTEAQAPAP